MKYYYEVSNSILDSFSQQNAGTTEPGSAELDVAHQTKSDSICPNASCDMVETTFRVHLDRLKGPLYNKSCKKCGVKITTKSMQLLPVYYCRKNRNPNDGDDDSSAGSNACTNVICGACFPAVTEKRVRTQRTFDDMNGKWP